MNPRTRWLIGLCLSMVTALCWGTLPLALRLCINVVEPLTVTWARVLFASVVLLLICGLKGTLPKLERFQGDAKLWLALACVGFAGNYIFYLEGLKSSTPGTAQLVIQTGPALLALAGIYFFKEHMSRRRWTGFGFIGVGFAIFFRGRIGELVGNVDVYLWGSLLVFISAIAWASYAIAQKKLVMRGWTTQQILVCLYIVSALSFTGMAEPGQLMKLDSIGWWALIYSCVNTVVGYGAFAEAMNYWDASRVSAVLALTPLMTLASIAVGHHFMPMAVGAEALNWSSWVGAFVTIVGSIVVAMR